MSTLTIIGTARSIMGSGTAENVTYRDDAGNEWYSVGGSVPVLTRTAVEVQRAAVLAAAARAAGIAARAAQ